MSQTLKLKPLIFHTLVRPIRKTLYTSLKVHHHSGKLLGRFYARYISFVVRRGLAMSFDSEDRRRCERYYATVQAAVGRLPIQPKISILMPVYKVPPEYLSEALACVSLQTYPNWELCIVDDASGDAVLAGLVKSFAAAHPSKVKTATNEKNLHISGTSNRCLELATGDFVTFLDHDDRIYPHALSEVVRHINELGDPDILYSDSRPIDEKGDVSENFFYKPDWSPFMHLAFHYGAHLTAYRASLVRKVGGFRLGFEGSQDYDLMLRCVEATPKAPAHIPLCLYQWRAHAGSAAATVAAKPYAVTAAMKALTEACVRRGRPAVVEFETYSEHYRVKFNLPEPRPLISVIIPTRNALDLLEPCVESVLASSYAPLEILIVDNGSDDPAALAYLKEKAHGGRVRVLSRPGPFNFAYLNNTAVQEAKGEYVVLLNNDTKTMHADWLEEMLRYAQFPEVGAVGGKLHFADGTIQHAGLMLVGPSIAGSAFERLGDWDGYYYHLINTPREVSAITAACLMIARAKYLSVGGLDEINLPNGYGDVDFCLKLREKGLNNVYTPYARLYHYESKTRGSAIETFERHHMLRRWGQQLLNDPYLNLNLMRSLRFEPNGFPLAEPSGEDFQWFLKRDPWFAGQPIPRIRPR